MRALFTLLAALLTFSAGYAQEINQKLDRFNKIIVSPKINLVLIPGETESIRITYHGVEADKIIVEQKGNRVHVYLDKAKILDLGERRDDMFDRRERYRFATVTAYVTFKDGLKLIETRGEGYVACDGNIVTKKIKVKAYGETSLHFAYIDAATVKARLYGSNKMRILDGNAGHLSYKLFGENKIESRGLHTVTSSTTIYGDGQVRLHASEELRVNAFGDQNLVVSGSPNISKGIIIGSTNIRRN